LQTLSDFLASAPKTYLSKLYRRDNPDAGLVSGSKVVEAVQARALDAGRLKEVLAEMEPECRRLLLAIYASEERGMLESELMRGCEGGSGPAGYFLGMLESELLVVRRDGEHRSYHGFREISRQILPGLLEEFVPRETVPPQTAWISNVPHAASHFCHFLAKAARGELRLTQTGELHRKSLTDLARGFASGDMLSSAVAEEEAVFLFRFAVDSDLLTEDAGVLRLSASAMEWLENGSGELEHRLRAWWLRRRARGLSRLLKALSGQPGELSADEALPVAALSPLFAVYEGWDKLRARATSDKMTWENLSRLLRELWLLGGAELAMTKGRIRWARVISYDEEGERDGKARRGEESPRGLPNFEALVPAGIPLARLFQVELLATRENDERLTRYRFTKDSVVAGLRAGLSPESLEELATWLGFEAPARRVMAEWAATYASAVFREVFMLRVRDAGRFAELESFPQFMELVTEVIPNYGFVLPRSARDSARELLHAFDLLPGEELESPAAGRRPVTAGEAEPAWSLPVFSHGEAVYRQVIPVRRETAIDRAAARERVEDPALRLRTLENAIAAQKPVEFNYAPGAGRLRIQPLHVLRNRDPMKLIAVDLASGHRNEYLIDQIQALRIEEAA
jgi:hypothetical protein